MTEETSRLAKGIEMFGEVYGKNSPPPANPEQSAFSKLMLENLFGDIWGREAMSVRDRRLIIIGVIAALAVDPSMLIEIQLKSALEKGELTPDQLREIPLILTQYVGYPRTVPVMFTVEKVLKEAGAG